MEEKLRHGAINSPIKRKLRRLFRKKAGASQPFNWSVPYNTLSLIQGNILVKNQYDSDACSGESKAYGLAFAEALRNKTPYLELSAKSIYSRIFYSGGGSTQGAMEKDLGATTEELVPSTQGGYVLENFMEDTSWETPANLQNASLRTGYTALSVNLDFDSIASAIALYGFVIIEIVGQNNGTWDSSNPQPPSGLNPNPTWNHFVCCIGADNIGGFPRITFINSWGNSVGNNGTQSITTKYLPFIKDAFTFYKALSVPKYIFNVNFGYGTQSEDVRQLQIRLNFPSYLQSGYFGLLTKFCLYMYQLKMGIPATAVVDDSTRTYLNL